VPIPEVVSLVAEVDARVVAISVSEATGGSPTTVRLKRLRESLPRRTALVVGGAGARPVAGARVIAELADLAEWGAKLAGGSAML
jgi:hypothetical protein